MDGNATIEVQRVVEEAKFGLPPSNPAAAHAKRSARRYGFVTFGLFGFGVVDTKFLAATTRNTEKTIEGAALIQRKILLLEIDFDPVSTSRGY